MYVYIIHTSIQSSCNIKGIIYIIWLCIFQDIYHTAYIDIRCLGIYMVFLLYTKHVQHPYNIKGSRQWRTHRSNAQLPQAYVMITMATTVKISLFFRFSFFPTVKEKAKDYRCVSTRFCAKNGVCTYTYMCLLLFAIVERDASLKMTDTH